MYFTVEKIEKQLAEIKANQFRAEFPIEQFKIFTGECPGAERVDFDDRGWADFHLGETWGGYDVTAWFRASVAIPAGMSGKKLALRLLVGPRDGGGSTAEALLFVNGTPLQGIDVWHSTAWLPPEMWQGKRAIQIALKAWSGSIEVPPVRCFKMASLVCIDEPSEQFFHLATNLLEALKTLPEDDLHRVELVAALQQAFLRIDFLKPRSEMYYRSVAEALSSLQRQVGDWQARQEVKPAVTGIGQAHIDMAWLWRVCQTREKAARTFSTALNLMRQYPEYRYMHSSPQLYQMLKEDYPEIFERVREKIAAGEWEITGGMWVEADTNLTGGESLIRQFLLGRRWVREEFGVEMETLWLPDVFGYSAALPQIALKSGMKQFLTSKISWNQYNRFPYDTFRWRGLDGSELLTYFITTPERESRSYTYNGMMDPFEVKGVWREYHQKDLNDELLLMFGWGDGGGGPTQEMIEAARAMKNLPGMPRVDMDKAEHFFTRLRERLEGKDVPVWDGELYLEYHRGTYTSQAHNKRSNRLAEVLYHDAEWISAVADVLTGEQAYPAAALRRGWERILLDQFHDILPGSSIREVYEDCRKDYAWIRETGEQAVQAGLARLAERVGAQRDSLLVVNPLGWQRDGLLELPWQDAFDETTAPRLQAAGAAQVSELDGERKLLLAVKDVPSLGYRTCPLVEETEPAAVETAQASFNANYPAIKAGELSTGDRANQGSFGKPEREALTPGERRALFEGMDSSIPVPPVAEELVVTPERVENPFYRILLNERGQLTSIWDKRAGREVLESGQPGNAFVAFEDKPMNFDAWDIDVYYQQKPRPVDDLVSAQVVDSGPLRGGLRFTWRFADSTITQDMLVYRDNPRIDFRTRVDWHEHQVLLKVAFPVAVRSTRATYEIQFGSVERPTHWNTSWDWARFEVPGHKWVDLSEGDYGVAILNDCKYGHDVKGNLMRLTLIKSGINPDPTADQGEHIFTYSLLPHAGDWRSAGVVEAAYELNYPLLAAALPAGQPGDLPENLAFAEVDARNVIVETLKQAEDGQGWIVRVYEAKQCRSSQVRLKFARPLTAAVECNLVEEEERPVEWDEQGIRFAIRPFEIKTFRVNFA